jgi:hypothetical protein
VILLRKFIVMTQAKPPNLWSLIEEETFSTPYPFKRSWHTAFVYEKSMYIFGGSYLVNSDLYVFNDIHAYNLGKHYIFILANKVVQNRLHGRD